jgi:prepilin-type N-terminal cleavage/methylation domain-containing protein
MTTPMKSMKNQQSGFTLVEIAIVLVIIGLLLGGILKGQELINSAKVKNMISDFRTTQAMVYGYQDKYKAFPGDQSQTQLDNNFAPAGAGTAGAIGNNNGRLDGNWNDTSGSESYVFWQHVRLANLATGTTVLTDPTIYRPKNADGGFIGIESGLTSTGAALPFIANMTGSFFVCSDGILGKYAKQIDATMDDGNTATGSIRVVLSAGAARGGAALPNASIVDGTQYLVCAGY